MLKPVYRFRNFRLDPQYRELRRDGELVPLPLKSFDCLVYLIEHRDRAVGRDELIAAVWGSADINDHTLAQTLSRARQALRDGDDEAASIRTVPRFGYCWVEPIERTEINVESAEVVQPTRAAPREPIIEPIAPTEASESPVARSHRPRYGIILAALLAVAGLGVMAVMLRGYDAPSRAHSTAAPARPTADRRIGAATYLVMPVIVDTDAADAAWISLGVMDYIGATLKQDSERTVLPSEQTVSLTASAKRTGPLDAAEIARLRTLTGAAHIVQARAQQIENSWRFVIDHYEGDDLHTYSGTGPTPLDASRAALQPFLGVLDHAATLAPLPSEGEALPRIDAALLVGDLEQAQRLLAANASMLAQSAAFRERAGQLALRQGNLDEARQVFRALIDESPSAISRAQLSEAWVGLANAELQRPDFDAAEAAYSAAVKLLHDGGNQQLLGKAYLGRGASYAHRDRFEEAMTDFGRARIAFDTAGDRIGLARLDINVAAADAYRGRLAQALEAQNRSIDVLTAFGVRDQLLVALHNKVYVQLSMLDCNGAAQTSREALDLAERFDNARMKARIAAARTRVLLATGQLTEAGQLIERFDPDSGAPSDPEFTWLKLQLLIEQGRYGGAADIAMASLERVAGTEALASQPTLAWTVLAGVTAAVRAQRPDLAERLIERAVKAPAPARDAERSAILDLCRAEVLQARGRSADARRLFASVLASAEREGDPGLIILAGTSWLQRVLDAHDLDQAAAISGRLKAYADKDYGAARALTAYYRASGQSMLADQTAAQVRALAGERDPRLPL